MRGMGSGKEIGLAPPLGKEGRENIVLHGSISLGGDALERRECATKNDISDGGGARVRGRGRAEGERAGGLGKVLAGKRHSAARRGHARCAAVT